MLVHRGAELAVGGHLVVQLLHQRRIRDLQIVEIAFQGLQLVDQGIDLDHFLFEVGVKRHMLRSPDFELLQKLGVLVDQLIVELGQLQALLLQAVRVGDDVMMLTQDLLQLDILLLLLIDLLLQTHNDGLEVAILDLLQLAVLFELGGDLLELDFDFLSGGQLPLPSKLVDLLGVGLLQADNVRLQFGVLPLDLVEM